MSTSTATPPSAGFDMRVSNVKLSKTDVNALIMDYLITEGYGNAARKFAKEANIHLAPLTDTIEERRAIKHAIFSGDIKEAIEQINKLNPEILDSNISLHFDLLRLQLVELIRSSTRPDSPANIAEAVEFAQRELAPRASTNKDFQKSLEKAMTLLMFSPGNPPPPDVAELLEPGLRQTVAARVNEEILASRGQRREANIKQLTRLRVYLEQKTRAQGKMGLPETVSIGLDPEDMDKDGEANGSDRGIGAAEQMEE